jgi:hypothetical protein
MTYTQRETKKILEQLQNEESRLAFVRESPDQVYRLIQIGASLLDIDFDCFKKESIQGKLKSLGQAFVAEYASNPNYHHTAYFASLTLGKPIQRKPVESLNPVRDDEGDCRIIRSSRYIGNAVSDTHSLTELNWRESNGWDDIVRVHESE